jgi:uncharacterized protein (DUF1501 family)
MLHRRNFLKSLGAAGAAAALGLPRIAFANIPGERRLVIVLLRGGMDGLGAVPPIGDADYASARGALALPAPGADGGVLPLDGIFGLNAALAPVQPLFQKREALAVHAVATGYRDRSHFDGQDVLENGTATPHATQNGWVNRALSLYGSSAGKLGLSVGQGVPLALRGAVPVHSWAPANLPGLPPDLLRKLEALYRGDAAFALAFEEGVQSEALATQMLGDDNKMGAVGPQANAFARLAPDAGKLLAAAEGPRVAVMECLGWDTHQGQGTVKGRLADTLRAFATGIADMATALGPAWNETIVIASTEFGRTVAGNGTGGTDHGTASAMFLFGGNLAGGHVLTARWPGLDRSRLYQGRDLVPTLDQRSVIKGVLRDHLEMPPEALDRAVFPQSEGLRAVGGLLRA